MKSMLFFGVAREGNRPESPARVEAKGRFRLKFSPRRDDGLTMPYRLNPEKPLSRELVRVAREQIEGAIKDIHQGRHDIHEAVHDVRRHCKLIRGLIRLVRPAFPEYRSENAWFRDLGRSLSATRDANGRRLKSKTAQEAVCQIPILSIALKNLLMTKLGAKSNNALAEKLAAKTGLAKNTVLNALKGGNLRPKTNAALAKLLKELK